MNVLVLGLPEKSDIHRTEILRIGRCRMQKDMEDTDPPIAGLRREIKAAGVQPLLVEEVWHPHL